jgi:hypothetical protein
MHSPIGRAVIGIVLLSTAEFGQTPSNPLKGGVTVNQDFCSTDASCYTPARGPQCPQVRFGWGNCPGSRQACDWCYGPSGVFAYAPRGSQYTLSSGCNQLGANATWATQDSGVAQWMANAGGNCASDGRGGYNCSNVNPAQFRQAANCGNAGGNPPAPPQQPPQQQPNPSTGDCSCYTPARGPQCPQVRFGWGDCPGSRQACDWCYGPNGVFAYTPRGSQYTLSSGCSQFGANTVWSTQSPQVEQSMINAGGNCASDGRGGYSCSNVDPGRYQAVANCGNSNPCSVSPPPVSPPPAGGPGTPSPISGNLPPTVFLSTGTPAGCQKIVFTYFYVNGINTPAGADSPPKPGQWRGNYRGEHDTVQANLIDDTSVLTSNPLLGAETPPIRPKNAQFQSIKVANETDTMFGDTHNPSGTDPLNAQWYNQNCKPPKNPALCTVVDQLNNWRAQGFFGMAPGDLFECFRQAIQSPIPQLGAPLDPLGFADATVLQVVNAIKAIYQQEKADPQTKNYFIVVGHSQGNFFVESIAWNLDHDLLGNEIYNNRLGLITLASPTAYESLEPWFRDSRIVHHTRGDDAINIVETIHSLIPNSKQPWPSNDPMLWPWPPAGGFNWFGLVPRIPDLFGLDQLLNGTFFRRMGYASGVSLNPELYTPLMNSHLLDNYLDVPPATQPHKLLKTDSSVMPVTWKFSPSTTPVLNCIRHDLLQLKKNLMNGTNTPVTTSCTGQ